MFGYTVFKETKSARVCTASAVNNPDPKSRNLGVFIIITIILTFVPFTDNDPLQFYCKYR